VRLVLCESRAAAPDGALL